MAVSHPPPVEEVIAKGRINAPAVILPKAAIPLVPSIEMFGSGSVRVLIGGGIFTF